MIRRIATAWLIVVLSLSCAGCWGRLELENQSHFTVLGVDNGTGKRLRLTARISVPRLTAGGENMGTGPESLASGIPISAEGQTTTDALNALQKLTGREVVASHLTIIVLGEEFAKQSIGPILDAFSRTLQFRPNTLVAVCSGKAEDFVQEFMPGEETEPSTLLTKIITSTSTNLGECPLVTMQDFVNASTTTECDPWAPYLTIGSAKAEQGGQKETSSDSGSGGSPKEGAKNQEIRIVKVLGSAVFANSGGHQRMVGTLDPRETFAAVLMSGKFAGGALQFTFPGTHEEVTLRLRHASVSIKVSVSDGETGAKCRVRLTSSIEDTAEHNAEDTLGEAFQKSVMFTAQDELRLLLTRTLQKLQSLNSDVIKMGRAAHGQFSSYPKWQEYDWTKNFPLVQTAFDIKLEILNSGFVYRHPFPR